MKYTINEEKIVFDDHYKIVKAKVTYDTFNGKQITTKRLAFERGDSVAILLLEKETQSILLTKQFRYPSCKNNEGWLTEIPAGSMEENEKPEECITREVMEELGYKTNHPKLISTFYTSPGASTERIFLFYAEVSLTDKTGKGGGNDAENEDIQLVKIPVSEIASKILKLKDAKTILALQWFLLEGCR
ncbi:NUDIX domain-containing protein [Aequorivita antarctica]|uniref:GDP-mannose pyrophosphatase n=1 Tax=Aequorivita antarctica TaxID=153266 RepID=A0A5C6Z127_9FLAO|nr:NUDIX hydrolase [Aequorivita antarctica]TXD73150.1 NUDIX hydrolase [Aequorivita antarctica]SRX74906.1 GDP-mannose pyrophosphatase NudK [Aequorivita antarctica]